MTKRQRFRDDIPEMIELAYKTLKEAGFEGAKQEVKIETFLDGVDVPITGYVDLLVPGDKFCEMKTKAPRKTRLLKNGEQGWSKPTLPKSVEYNHLLQAAIYWHALKVTPTVCYIAAHDIKLFTPDNCDDLKEERLMEMVEDARQKALLRQNLISLSADPKVLASITDPDWQHAYQWKINPDFYKEARKLWQS